MEKTTENSGKNRRLRNDKGRSEIRFARSSIVSRMSNCPIDRIKIVSRRIVADLYIIRRRKKKGKRVRKLHVDEGCGSINV